MKRFLIPLVFFLLLCPAAAQTDRPDVNTDEQKVAPYVLPDPLALSDGTIVTTVAQWEQVRRPELWELFAREMYGRMPEGPVSQRFETIDTDTTYAGGRATHKSVRIHFAHEGRTHEAMLHLYLPNGIGKVPVFQYFAGEMAPDDSRLVRLLEAGYGLCTGNYSDFFPDRRDDPSVYGESVLNLWGYDREEALPDDCCRALGVWAWAHSRALDYLETDPQVDASRVVVMGFSRGGKAAAWAAASDRRFALAVLNNSGCGGAALFRRKFGETAYRINLAFPYWFCGNFHQYDFREEALPVDQHELIALIAPRPVYVGSGAEDSWSDPKGEFLAVAHAEPVYNLYGYHGVGTDVLPPVDHPVGNRAAYHIRTGGHAVADYDWEQYIRFADRWLAGSALHRSAADDFPTEAVIRSADVVRQTYSTTPTVYLYQGNGQFGSSYGPLGLHLHPARKDPAWGKTHYLHLNHRGRGKFNHDYLLPLLEIYWANDFDRVSDYTQHQSYYDGTITTAFSTGDNHFEVQTWFDPIEQSLSMITVQAAEGGEKIILAPCKDLQVHYGQQLTQQTTITGANSEWQLTFACLDKRSEVYVHTDAAVSVTGGMLELTLREGSNHIAVAYGEPVRLTAEQSLAQTCAWWHRQWEESGCLALPEARAQQTWVRSMAMFLASYDASKQGLAPPMGYTGNWWPFYYPQDVSYVHPVLLQTGHVDITRSWVEYWAERLDGMRQYTQRLYGVDGLLAPWVYPYGSFEGYHDPTPPNRFFYEIHNSGYFARMACETAVHVNDAAWTERYALPILAGCAEFYANIATKGDDGRWHLFVTPSMGQDERGGADQHDYLCAMYSALYCFQQAVRFGIDETGRYARILDDGLAFDGLKSAQGFYYSCAGRGEADFGMQKHPVQLNELAFLPVGEAPSASASLVYDLRYDITRDARKPYFYGWTLGEFLLAGTRMGRPDGWIIDWENMERSAYVDPEWIQIYETSGNTTTSFYNITNGLVAQSLLGNLVCDWYGRLELAKCNPWQGIVRVRNIRTLLGVTVDGTFEGHSCDVMLTAWKDTAFRMDEREIVLKKGEQLHYTR